MIPFLEVSHLASSTSFYSAVVQPLGLRYISAGSASVTFGTATFPPVPVLELRQVTPTPARHLKPSRLVLSAGSPAAVDDFHAFAHRASASSTPAALPHSGRSLGPGDTASVGSADEAGERRAKITDFDGNIMEVVYVPPPDYPSRFGGSTVRKTQSTHDEVTRILDWNYDVASSVPPSAAATSVRGSNLALSRRPGRYPDDEPYSLLRRSVTTTSMLEPTSAPSPRQNSNGLSTGAVVGTLLGVAAAGAAAGAALTYSMIKSDRARAPLQEFEAPAFQRRSTFPEPSPDRRGRFMEVERTVEKVRYPEDYTPVAADHRPAPSYIARYSQAPASRSKERGTSAVYPSQLDL
ncbi:putative cystathionine gamma-synthase protein [Phaeoacremonium minimum UCRPA7]|uniref:Putative cystathionine gamma-synthase protein n=1 Tax=Phaeoacremonium minimum (strain UCR-PA7) TaxID=1286976 RepID=R8BT60_PHAM7|nr:putative cystathionine gamma-synthase protein [Phaeoacremonium minimum UCRPA7]EOO02536.1 putative cystathionine gamma-synthase protein [Phaeoacremonium minimum UCRPA7]